MVIEIEGCGFRIKGTGVDWAIEYPNKGQKSGWKGRYFYPSLEHAIGKAYELAIMESPKEAVDIREAAAECERVKTRLLKAVKKAVES